MATVKSSDLAPNEKVHYTLANVEFDLTKRGSYKTDDREVISNAEAHPWLVVEYDTQEVTPRFTESHVARKDDALAAENSKAFDPKLVEEQAGGNIEADPTAIESGLDQEKPVEEGGVDQTLAADDAKDTDK